MANAFTCHVPSDVRYRGIAGDVAARFVDAIGGTRADAEAFNASVAAMVETLSAAGDDIELAFEQVAVGVEVAIRCGSERRHVRHALTVVNR